MRYSPPTTVDIASESVVPSRYEETSPEIRLAIQQSLGTDIFIIFISLMMGLLFSSAVGAIETSHTEDSYLLLPPLWFVFLSCGLPALIFLITDSLNAFTNSVALPFAASEKKTKAVYAKRAHLILLSFYFSAILVALCWSAFAMMLVSKIFVAAIFALALYSLGQSIPSQRLSFIVSGILFLVVLIATQVFIVTKMEADTAKAGEALRNQLEQGQLAGEELEEEEE